MRPREIERLREKMGGERMECDEDEEKLKRESELNGVSMERQFAFFKVVGEFLRGYVPYFYGSILLRSV
jgi:hypothetical protein